MSVRLGTRGIILSFGWALFWYGVYWAGVEVQTWVFSKDAGPKPAAADLLAPLHFWLPAVFFFWPVWSTQGLLSRFFPTPEGMMGTIRVAAGAWSFAVAVLMVWLEERLRPETAHRIGAWVLPGIVVVLLALRLAGGDESLGVWTSGLLLTGLVLATYLFIAIGLAGLAIRSFRRRGPG